EGARAAPSRSEEAGGEVGDEASAGLGPLGRGPRERREVDAVGEASPGTDRALSRPAGGRTMFSMPLAYSSTLDRRPPGALAATVAVLRGGALEPEPRAVSEKRQAKADVYCERVFPACSRGSFSLRRGLDLI